MLTMNILAPAKLILFGEHSIVYPGQNAVLVALGIYTSVKVQSNNSNDFNVLINIHNSVVKIKFSIEEGIELFKKAQEERKKFLKTEDISQLKELMGTDLNSYRIIVGSIAKSIKLDGCDIYIDIDIPLGSGMGSSASITSSIIYAIYKVNNHHINQEKLFLLTKAIEDFQHGRSSGADPACVINGGIVHYHHNIDGSKTFENIKLKSGWDNDLVLVNSGRPIETTGEMVAFVRNKFIDKSQNYLEKINGIVSRFVKNDFDDISELINENGLLLEEIGVVSNQVIKFSKEIRALGGAVKICGGGGRFGIGSGILLCKLKDKEKLDALLSEYKFVKMPIQFAVTGIKF